MKQPCVNILINEKKKPLLNFRYKGQKEVRKSPKYEMSYEDEVASLVIHKTEPDDTGVYSLQATNQLGQVKSEGNLAVHSKFVCLTLYNTIPTFNDLDKETF